MRRLVLLLVAVLALAGCQHRAEPASQPTTTTTIASGRCAPPAVYLARGKPSPCLTPGVIRTSDASDVCTPGWASKHRSGLTAKQKATVLAAYGYPAGQKVIEWDHFVSLELGGGNGPQNIWPQVSDTDQQRKDRLENRLHGEVCAGKMKLAEAQDHIKRYWQFW